MKGALRGLDFKAQEEALTPVQAKKKPGQVQASAAGLVVQKEASHESKIKRMSGGDLEKVVKVQKGDVSPWEQANVKKDRNNANRPKEDWLLSKCEWTLEDVVLAKRFAASAPAVKLKVETELKSGSEKEKSRTVTHEKKAKPGEESATWDKSTVDQKKEETKSKDGTSSKKQTVTTNANGRTGEASDSSTSKNADGSSSARSSSNKQENKAGGNYSEERSGSTSTTAADGSSTGTSESRSYGRKADGSTTNATSETTTTTEANGNKTVRTAGTTRDVDPDGNETATEGVVGETAQAPAAAPAKKGLAIPTEVAGTLAEGEAWKKDWKSDELDKALKEYNRNFDLGGNVVVTLEAKLGAVSGGLKASSSGTGKVAVGQAAAPAAATGAAATGTTEAKSDAGGGPKLEAEAAAKAAASAELKATAIEGKASISWHGDTTIMGEEVGAKVAAEAEFMVGAEVAAKADVGATLRGGVKADKAGVNATGAMSGEAFAGAKGSIGGAAKLEWKKKKPQAYDMAATAAAIMRLGATLFGPGPIAYVCAELLDAMGADELIGFVMDQLLKWGPAGDIALLSIEGKGEGSAGIGAKAGLDAGFSGGKVTFKALVGVTFGVGAGGSVKVSADCVQGPLFLIIIAGEAMKEIEGWLKAQIKDGLMAIAGWGGKLLDWFDEDDKAVELIRNDGHTLMGAQDRAQLVDKMLDWRVSGESEEMLIKVLRYSQDTRGDLSTVIGGMGHSVKELLSAIDGQNYDTLDNVLRGAVVWMTKIGELGASVGGQVFTDDPKGPYIYFEDEDEADDCDVSGGKTVFESHSQTAGFNYYMMMDAMNHAETFYRPDGQAGESLYAGFESVDEAKDASFGGGGIWADNKK